MHQKDVRLPTNRYVFFLLLMLGGSLLDLGSKWYVFENYFQPELMVAGHGQHVQWWIDGVFGLQCSTNPGALFGIGKGLSYVFAAVSFVAIFGILVWLFWFKQAIDRWMNFALGLITGGIIGNLYDRLGFGYKPEYPEQIRDNVRDWILFRWEGGPALFDPWPNFNIADSLLVTGAILLLLHAFFVTEPTVEKKRSST
ncbi:MAG: signal peptidase II [Planctomycetota bacterium]